MQASLSTSCALLLHTLYAQGGAECSRTASAILAACTPAGTLCMRRICAPDVAHRAAAAALAMSLLPVSCSPACKAPVMLTAVTSCTLLRKVGVQAGHRQCAYL